MLRQSSDRQNFLEKSSDLFISRVAKALDAGISCSNSPPVRLKKTKRLRKTSVLRNAKGPAKGLSSGNDNINVDSVKADVVLLSFGKYRFLFCCSFSCPRTVQYRCSLVGSVVYLFIFLNGTFTVNGDEMVWNMVCWFHCNIPWSVAVPTYQIA